MHLVTRRLMALLIGSCMLAAVGCSKTPKMQPLNLRVAPDQALKERGSLRVHLVGIQGEDELGKLQRKDVGEWFSENDTLRRGLQDRIKELSFTTNNFGEQVVNTSDPAWGAWKANNAMHLVVLANWTARGQRFDPTTDPRKRVIPLDSKRWEGVREVRIEIKESGIFVNPPPKPQ